MLAFEMGKQFHVLVLGNVHEEGLDILRDFADLTILPEPVQKTDLLKTIPHTNGVLHKVAKIDADVLHAQKKVRILARHGVGLDDLDLDALRRAGIPVSITETANANAVAEATIGLALAATRHFVWGDKMIKHDKVWERERMIGKEIAGATVGIVGFGRIGRRVADLFHAFGADIAVHDASPVKQCHYPVLTLEELLKTSEFVCLHCPLTSETRNLMNDARLPMMKPGAILINTSRGGLIDTDALVRALEHGPISGAALDVFDTEPPDFDHPLFTLPNVLTTPHVAAMTVEAQVAMAIRSANEIRRVLVESLAPTNNVLAN